jgi:serine/threonine-protein kinase
MHGDDPEGEDEAVREAPAPLPPGTRLGRYEVKSLLGSGGMGSVYRAVDSALDREVAIKALAKTFHGDSGSLKRFEREARLLASLNHPNVAAIYGFEVLDGAPYLVLEKVEGETLAQRLKRGPLPPKEALKVALQIADGLAEAHEKGVVHRDLKPSNVMLASGGRVKLVDFGLAKTSTRRAPEDASTHLTASGEVVGTAPYMSPEQIHGETVDGRTDVWSFGCVFYEILAGRAAFVGRSAHEIAASVLRDEPDWSALPSSVSDATRRLLERCLRKDPRARLQHIGDARLDLVDLSGEQPSHPTRPMKAVPASKLPWVVAGVAALVAAGAVVFAARRSAAPPEVRLSLDLPRNLKLASEYDAPFAVSPSGRLLVVAASENGASRLYSRPLDDVTLTAIPGTEGGRAPFFSPDGRSLGFFADRKLKRVPLEGGPATTLCEIGNNQRGGTWAPDGTIIFAPSQTAGLSRASDSGSPPSALTSLDDSRGEASHRWPDVLPGGKWVLFTDALEGSGYDEARLEAVSLTTGERRMILQNASFGRYSPSGHILFVRGGQLYAVRFDPGNLKTLGHPQVVLGGVRYDPGNGAAHVAVSPSGTLVYGPGVPFTPELYLAWLALDGKLTRLSETPRMFRDPSLSPDGTKVAVVVGPAAESDLWIVEAASGNLARLSFSLAPRRPTWTPDGARVTVGAEKDGEWRLVSLPVSGGAPVNVLTSKRRVYPSAWSPDGRRLVYQERRAETGWDLVTVEVGADGRAAGSPHALAATPFHEANASISRDGRFIAYESDELDALVQAHVLSFPDGRLKVRASTSGARYPVWGKGRELFYWDTALHRLSSTVLEEKDGRVMPSAARGVFPGEGARPPALQDVVVNMTGARYDENPRTGSFLVLETSNTSVDPPLSRPVVVPGFADSLARKLRP